ncbi:hypothetical protein [Comamonas endophytica]
MSMLVFGPQPQEQSLRSAAWTTPRHRMARLQRFLTLELSHVCTV